MPDWRPNNLGPQRHNAPGDAENRRVFYIVGVLLDIPCEMALYIMATIVAESAIARNQRYSKWREANEAKIAVSRQLGGGRARHGGGIGSCPNREKCRAHIAAALANQYKYAL